MFDVKGTTLQNFNVDNSFVKKVGRTSNKLIPKCAEIGRALVKSELLNIKTKSREATGRFNDTTVLVRVLS